MRALAALTLAALLAGCASEAPLAQTRLSDEASSPAWYIEQRSMVRPGHEKAYEVPVARGASFLGATLHLDAEDAGLGLPTAPGARLTVSILSPDGVSVANATVDPVAPDAMARFASPPPGAYSVRVTGVGLSTEVEGGDYGAYYLLAIEVG